jgi:hypothetical protein
LLALASQQGVHGHIICERGENTSAVRSSQFTGKSKIEQAGEEGAVKKGYFFK